MKKFVCMFLTVTCLIAFASPVFAVTYPTGTVHVATWLNVRKEPSASSSLVGYLQNGQKVSVIRMDAGIYPFYYIKGGIHDTHYWADDAISPVAYGFDAEVNAVEKYGYVHRDYVTVSY